MHNRNSGFGIIESMLTLALFAAVTMSIIFFTSHNAANKDAKILSAQTEAFAATYAKYLKSNYDTLVERIQAGPVTFSPQALDLQHVWPSDLSKANMYQQTPCVTVVKNSDTGEMEALMYYTGVSTHQSALAANIVRNASIWLGSKGGILLNGKIQGNSGWYINNGSVFLSGVSLCGGSLANNSLAINLDLLPEWNQNLQPVYSILRGIDNTSGQLSLPGRLKNANTAKSNIYFSQSNGIILDKTYPENPIKLGVTDTGSGSPGTASVGLTNTMSDRLTLDTLQPNLAYPAGTPCNAQEEGKTVADKEIPGVTNNILARSTLICTKSDLLCGTGSYCYLTSIPNKIIFQNKTIGIQNSERRFICTKSVPFAVDIKTGIPGGGEIYVFVNKGVATPTDTITVWLKMRNGGQSIFPNFNCPKSGCNPPIVANLIWWEYYVKGELASIDLSTIRGNQVGEITSENANPGYTPISESMGNYSTAVGYTVNSTLDPASCDQVCGDLSQILYNKWQLLGKHRGGGGVNIDYSNGCACERTDFDSPFDSYRGIAAVIESGKPIIISATCSNMPLYNKN
jgi:hypothetical protein